MALFAGEDGHSIYRRIVTDAQRVLKPGGYLIFELGYRSLDAVRAMLGKGHAERRPSREDGRSYDVALTEAGIAAHAAAREAFDVVNRRFLERLPAPEGELRATLAGIIAATG